MVMQMLKFLCMILVISLFGCVSPKQIMVNPANWQQTMCRAWGFGWLGVPIAYSKFNDCVNNQKVLGYITLEEAELNDTPKFDVSLDFSGKKAEKPMWNKNYSWEYSGSGNSSNKKIVVLNNEYYKGEKSYSLQVSDGKIIILNDSLDLIAVMNKGVIESEYDPSLHIYDWPLYVGKMWGFKSLMKKNSGTMELSGQYEVKGYGEIKVPAGEFEAYYILLRSEYGARISELWWSPLVKYYVKRVMYHNTGKVIEELIKYSIANN